MSAQTVLSSTDDLGDVTDEPIRDDQPKDHVALAYIRDSQNGNLITKLGRYQTTLERSFYRALHDLENRRELENRRHNTNRHAGH